MGSCDTRGAVLPFPYGTGAGYFFSAALLQHVATSAEVTQWVADAAGPEHETLQWQKFEDTSTGYMVSRAPRTVHYIDIGPLVHDIACHPQGERKRRGGATYRPPANSSVLVHNLKGPAAFSFAWEHMQPETTPYEHERCEQQVYRNGAPKRRPPARGASGVSNARWPRRPQEAAAAAAAGGGGGERSGRRRQGYRRATDDRIRVRPRCLHLRALCPRDARHDACFAMPRAPPPAPSIAARPRRSSLRRSSRWAALVKLGRAECIAHFTKGAARRSIRGRLWRGRKLSAMLSAGRVHRCLLGTSGHLSDSKPRLN